MRVVTGAARPWLSSAKYWDERRASNILIHNGASLRRFARSYGVCMTMGTASTMTAIAEALGVCLSGSSSIPAPDANHKRMAAACGRRVVDLVFEDIKLTDIITPAIVENAVKVAMASGCSTNAIIHLIAIARRAGVELGLDDFDRLSKDVPVLANIRPTGDTYLMEDFYYVGGLPAMMKQMEDKLDLSVTNDGTSLKQNIATADCHNEDVIRPLSTPSIIRAHWLFCAAILRLMGQ